MHDINYFYLLYRNRNSKSTQSQNEAVHSTQRGGGFSTVGSSTHKIAPGAQTVIVRCPDGHRSVPGRSSAIGRFVKSFFSNSPSAFQTSYDARTVAIEIVPLKFKKRRTGAKEFLVVPKPHRAPYEV